MTPAFSRIRLPSVLFAVRGLPSTTLNTSRVRPKNANRRHARNMAATARWPVSNAARITRSSLKNGPNGGHAVTANIPATKIAADCGVSEDEPEVCACIIGEIGVSKDFTPAEEKVLRGAARASRISGAPLTIHLPGWERLAHRVLDVVEQEGGDLRHTILCHMNPSLHDPQYQKSLADRGAFIEYDMIGMDYFYADQQAQSPSDEENAIAICRLVDDGYLNAILMSQDVFLKMMLIRHGGFGYGYILKHFVPRLKRHGMSQKTIDDILIENPRRVFSAAHRAR